jgi:hypothetical protein
MLNGYDTLEKRVFVAAVFLAEVLNAMAGFEIHYGAGADVFN